MRRQTELTSTIVKQFLIACGAPLLTSSAYVLLDLLVVHMNFKTGRAYPSTEWLSRRMGVHRKTVSGLLKELAGHGFIAYKRSRRLHWRNQYSFPWWDSRDLLHFAMAFRARLTGRFEGPAEARFPNPALVTFLGYCFGNENTTKDFFEPQKSGALVRQGLDYSEVSPPTLSAGAHPPTTQHDQNLTEEKMPRDFSFLLGPITAALSPPLSKKKLPKPQLRYMEEVRHGPDAGEKAFHKTMEELLQKEEKS